MLLLFLDYILIIKHEWVLFLSNHIMMPQPLNNNPSTVLNLHSILVRLCDFSAYFYSAEQDWLDFPLHSITLDWIPFCIIMGNQARVQQWVFILQMYFIDLMIPQGIIDIFVNSQKDI